ncbi:hypothetical protein LAh8_87 [Aeromonas phage LAh_8]|uniref:Uncharacterized protein n=2 Tax=Lahexavirus TaxID=2843411 RepID=A0A513ZZV5_9CAUD|nr:hypothetical protein HWC30_gp029 [Aeromonas phage LAh_6]YP_009847426.1 hypothetical protein HWC31_gp088 [Aeromonas phage LAh_8]QDH46525.1 hypothetical protein LAh6_29 [Aeromonas phage LAh_6]QDH46761.1 hypothetical protein LAh8_87 [Aeromonas phage LAh_8]
MNPVIILNAPPQSGKDTLANVLKKRFPLMRETSFKLPLYHLYCQTVGIDYSDFMDLYNTVGWKDTPNTELNGKTPRELMIHISENYIKPFFGDTYFGEQVSKQIEFYEYSREEEFSWVIPDGGFDSETEHMLKLLGERLVCIQFTRDNKNFDNDSRNWIKNIDNTIWIDHPGEPEQMADLVIEVLTKQGYVL